MEDAADMHWLDIMNVIIFYTAIFLLSWNTSILIFNRAVPNIATAPAIRREVIELLKKDMARRGGAPYTVIDVGSGNGLFTREIAEAMPEARVLGLEISYPAYKWSRAMKHYHKLDNLDYKRTDFFKYDMSPANAVVMFFFRMDPAAKKLRRELKPGTLVCSTSFKLLDGWVAAEEREVKTLHPFQKKLFVYYSPGPDQA
ncbi:MAG: methyltransferase domain-containing protein [Alphaproteobacteria bacterium]